LFLLGGLAVLACCVKHVWILNHYAQVPSGAGGIRHYGLASNLPQYGWSASIIAASVEHVTGRQRLTGALFRKLETITGISWLWIRTPRYQGNGIGRILNMLVFSFLAIIPGVTKGLPKPDIIIGSSVHPFAALAGVILATRYKVPFIFEVRDLWPATLIDMNKISATGFSAKLLLRLEKWLAHKAALVIVSMPKAVEYYQDLGVSEDNILALPNGADVSVEAPSAPNEDNCFTLMYCGAMGAANSLDTLIDALALVERNWQGNRKFECRLIGGGPLCISLKARASELGLKSISFEPPVPKKKISKLLLEADAFVITLKNMPRLYRFGISMNKIFDYLSMGRPVIMAADVPENPVELSRAGIVVEPESPEALSKAILNLSESSASERNEMGQNGWRYVLEHYNYSRLAEKLALALDSVIATDNR
jgi:glycosyltransferase involved in cell wall biosynthesis